MASSCRDELLEQMESQRAAKRRTLEERGGDDLFATAHTDTLGSVQQTPDNTAQEVSSIALRLTLPAVSGSTSPCYATHFAIPSRHL